jgi:hypothetical protein
VNGGNRCRAPLGGQEQATPSGAIVELVQRILHPRQQSGFVFPGSQDGRINAGDKLTRAIIKAGGNEGFFFHGCCHIAETKMAELRVPAHIRDGLFDHVEDRGSGRGYDHHEYEPEMREAL